MTLSAAPHVSVLDRLRRERSNIDWRRERPHVQLDDFRAQVADAVAGRKLSATQQLEAGALLCRLALDPLATLEGLIRVIEAASPRTRAAHRLLLELVSQWNDAVGALRGRGASEEAVRQVKRAARQAMDAFAGRNPEDEDIQYAFAAFVRRSSGSNALLEHVEQSKAPVGRVVSEYLVTLIEVLIQRPDPAILERAFSARLPVVDPASPAFLRFRFHRAVAVRMLAWNCEFRASFGTPALRVGLQSIAGPDPACELDAVRRVLPSRTPDVQADIVIGLCGCPALWRCPALEGARLNLLELLLEVAACTREHQILHRLLKALLEFAPQTVAFWAGTGWPRRLHGFVASKKGILPGGIHAALMGLSAFALPDLDAVQHSFSEANREGVTSSPQFTYLDPRSVAPSSDPEILNRDELRFLDALSVDGCTASSLLVAASADTGYFRLHAPDWARSLHASGSNADVHFHIVGDPDAVATEIAEVLAALPGHRVSFSAENPPVHKAFYFATSRFLHAFRWLERHKKTLIVSDIDVRWTVSPGTLDATAGSGDVGLRIFDCVRHYVNASSNEVLLRYPRLKLWECTSASCLLLRPNAGGKRFAMLLADIASQHLRKYLTEPGSHWFIDQNILSALYSYARRTYPEIKFANLDRNGLGLSGFSIFEDERLLQTYGSHWISGEDEG